MNDSDKRTTLSIWYEQNSADVKAFKCREKFHYVIEPDHLWNSIAELASVQNPELLRTLQNGFKYI